jgi:hypothetical protein
MSVDFCSISKNRIWIIGRTTSVLAIDPLARR